MFKQVKLAFGEFFKGKYYKVKLNMAFKSEIEIKEELLVTTEEIRSIGQLSEQESGLEGIQVRKLLK